MNWRFFLQQTKTQREKKWNENFRAQVSCRLKSLLFSFPFFLIHFLPFLDTSSDSLLYIQFLYTISIYFFVKFVYCRNKKRRLFLFRLFLLRLWHTSSLRLVAKSPFLPYSSVWQYFWLEHIYVQYTCLCMSIPLTSMVNIKS